MNNNEYPEKGFGIIYKATSPSGLVYIGQTVTSLSIRIKRHYTKLKQEKDNKFKKILISYNKEDIKWEILYEQVPENILKEMEAWIISAYNSFTNGLNSMSSGGHKGFHSPEVIERISKKTIKQFSTKESRIIISKRQKEFYNSDKAIEIKINKSIKMKEFYSDPANILIARDRHLKRLEDPLYIQKHKEGRSKAVSTRIIGNKKQKNNTSGVFGVYHDKSRDKWVALQPNKKIKPIQKRFNTKEEAAAQRKLWEDNYIKSV